MRSTEIRLQELLAMLIVIMLEIDGRMEQGRRGKRRHLA